MYRIARNSTRIASSLRPYATGRRQLMDETVRKPKVEQVVHTSHDRPAPGAASSVKDGTMGTNPLSAGDTAHTFRKQLPKAFGALAVVLGLFVVLPFGTVEASDIADSVPRQDTAAAKITKDGKVEVDIPQTYAHLDKPSDDDE
ncbi:hypothetical protein JA9_001076 [Meyerozyma sp. JA9]|nr:hypothetical protein JA9_001076 [Meyerozyma sp. JA9]